MTALDKASPCPEIDPDPFTIACAYFAGAALILQFVQIWQAASSKKPEQPRVTIIITEQGRSQRLAGLDVELDAMRRHLRQVTRAVERGSLNSDQQFFDASFRVGDISMQLSQDQHQLLTTDLGQAYSRLGNFSIWLNTIIGHDTALSIEIGQRLERRVPDAAKHLNKLMAGGEKNRSIIVEANRVMDALDEIIREMQDSN